MYDINYKNVRKGYMLGSIFIGVSIIFFIVFGFFIFNGAVKKSKMDSEVEAYKIEENCRLDDEGETMCSPIYYYRVDNIDYVCKNSFSSNKRVSSELNKVYYDSKNPNNCVTEYNSDIGFIEIIVMTIPIILFVVGIYQNIKVSKKMKKMKYLAQYGTLIENLPYTMKPTNMTYNNERLFAINIEYKMPDGTIKTLVGDPRFDYKRGDNDGLVDLLIDLSNPDNYYIDFNIDRKY